VVLGSLGAAAKKRFVGIGQNWLLRKITPWIDKVFFVCGLALLTYVVCRFPLHDIGRACLSLGPRRVST
jgi:hypothetical protein